MNDYLFYNFYKYIKYGLIMDKKNKIWIWPLLVMGLLLILTSGCKKTDNNPTDTLTKITDKDGNVYKTVTIGKQVWMAENLKTTKFSDNTAIPKVSDLTAWTHLSTPAYCWYDNDSATNKPLYGAIYNWFTVNTGNLCPTGWHAATDDEYDTLELYLGIVRADLNLWGWRGTDQGAKMKNSSGWAIGENGTNTSGFSALPGGYRYAASGTFNDLGNLSYWWTATNDGTEGAWYRRLDGNNNGIYKASTGQTAGKYVRCVKDK